MPAAILLAVSPVLTTTRVALPAWSAASGFVGAEGVAATAGLGGVVGRDESGCVAGAGALVVVLAAGPGAALICAGVGAMGAGLRSAGGSNSMV